VPSHRITPDDKGVCPLVSLLEYAPVINGASVLQRSITRPADHVWCDDDGGTIQHVYLSLTNGYIDTVGLEEVSGLVKYMIPVSSHTFAPEHRWEAKPFRHLILIDTLVASFRLTDHELAELRDRWSARGSSGKAVEGRLT